MKSFLLRRLARRGAWARIGKERLTEPLHLNALSIFVWLFGSFRSKVAHDLIVRQHNAYCILKCADDARRLGIQRLSLIEFGVAAGAGLMNMARIAADVTKATGVELRIYGFDTGSGMPPSLDYRDHPDLYREADFPMDFDRLKEALPDNVELLIGNVADTVPAFLRALPSTQPIGYVVFDLDYYSSTMDAFRVLLSDDPAKYLPIVQAYFDDTDHERHNAWCGELLAIREFNAGKQLRKIERYRFLEDSRIFRRARWLKRVYWIHMLDHPIRNRPLNKPTRALVNPYL